MHNIQTIRDFNNAYTLCMQIVNGQIGKNELVGEGEAAKVEFVPVFSKRGAIAYAAKRFTELNSDAIKAINNTVSDKEFELCLQDKDTGEALLADAGKPHKYRFTKDNQKIFERWFDDYFSSPIDFEIKTFICPKDKTPEEIPVDFSILNGLIFKYDFYEVFDPVQC